MQMSGEQLLPVSQATAWQALNDTSILQAAIPGCESIEPIGPHSYQLAMTAAIGPVKARFKGKMDLEDVVAPTSYTIRFEGQGGAAGHGKGQASVTLAAVDAGQTRLAYTATAQVGGKIAQVGSRLVDMAAQKMANDFFSNFTRVLAERGAASATDGGAAAPLAAATEPPPPPPPSSPAGPWARLLHWFRRFFGG